MNRLLESLSDAERQRLAPYQREVELRRNECLLEAGRTVDHVWFPHGCIASTAVHMPGGSTIDVGLIGLKGMVGLSLLLGIGISSATVIVQTTGKATRMAAADFIRHVVEPRGELYDSLLRYTDSFMATVAQTAACNSLHTVDERLSRWILMVADRTGQSELDLTQEFIAQALGVRRASVSLAAGQLQHLGLIRYNRGHIVILRQAGLEKHACDCYHIMQTISDRVFLQPAV